MRKTKPFAVLNGFGRTLGDGIIGLQAAYAAHHLGMIPKPTLLRHPASSPMARALHDMAADFVDLDELPAELSGTPPEELPADFARAYDRVLDIRDFAFDPGFRGVAMVDYFLGKLGLTPDSVPAELRRNTWLAPRIIWQRPPGLPDRYVLFCPHAAAPHRCIPPQAETRLLGMMLASQALPVVTQGEANSPRVTAAPHCTKIEQLCGLVAGAELIVSTDTAMVHLADAFSRPCLSIFTTHEPQWRVRDYPQAVPVKLPVTGLPPALEFTRSEVDVMAIRQGWDDGANHLDTTLARFLGQ